MAMVKVTSTQESNNQNNLLNTKGTSNNFLQDSSFVLKLDSNNRNLIKKTNDDEEIDIFSAEKYFNEGVDQENPTNLEPKRYNLDDQKVRPKTPSIQSESSWNSRSQLLHNFSRHHQQQQHQQPSTKSNKNFKKLFSTLSCNCVCKGKESVKVDHQICKKQNPIIKTRNLSQSSNHQDLNFIKKVETTRKPLDVFGLTQTEKKAEEKLSVEKKLSMLTWDAVVTKQEEIEDQDYAESDASSDLFEIESFPSNNNNNATNYYGPSLGRQSSDGMSSYAPSEVSIEWSVVTASAADFSIMSDTEEFKSGHRIVHQTTEKSKRRSSTLLGCNSHKSVGVVGDNNNNAYKVSERTSMEMQQRQIKNENVMPIMPMTRFHAESKVMNRFDGGNRKHDFTTNTRSFSSSYAGRPADLLYI